MNRLTIFDHEMHLDVFGPVKVGDVVEVVRGNGPREGDRMGAAVVTAIEDGAPVLDVHFDGQPCRWRLR